MKIDIWVARVRLVRDAAGPLESKPRCSYAVLAIDGVHAATILRDHLAQIWTSAGVVFEITGLACRGNLVQIDSYGNVDEAHEVSAIATLNLDRPVHTCSPDVGTPCVPCGISAEQAARGKAPTR